MDHQLEELFYLSLETARFALEDSSHPLASRRVCRRRILGPERAMSRRPARTSSRLAGGENLAKDGGSREVDIDRPIKAQAEPRLAQAAEPVIDLIPDLKQDFHSR